MIYDCKYHVVICPKYRNCVLKDEKAEYTRQPLYRLASQKDLVEILELNTQPDHIHIVLLIPPKVRKVPGRERKGDRKRSTEPEILI